MRGLVLLAGVIGCAERALPLPESPADLGHPPKDLATAQDLASPADFAAADLTRPPDLTTPPDLTPPPPPMLERGATLGASIRILAGDLDGDGAPDLVTLGWGGASGGWSAD